jgi:hypothetical protein
MGRSNRFADMYEVYADTKTTRNEQLAIRLRHMGRGPKDCCHQPRPQFAVAEGKSKVETQQYKEDQFRALEDRREASPTQISNLYRHNGNESRHPSAERRTHGRQHHVQAHATRWVDGFKLDIPEFQGDLQPKEFMDWVVAVGEVLDFKEVPEDRRVSLVATKLIDEDLSVDWASPPIYDIYPNEEGLLEEINLVLDTINIVEGNDVHLVFEENPKSEISQWGLEKINYIDFLGVKTFLSTFPKQNLDVGVGMMEEIGVNNFKYNTRSMPMIKSVAFILM